VEHFRAKSLNVDKILYLLHSINSQVAMVKKRKISERYRYIPVYSLKVPLIG